MGDAGAVGDEHRRAVVGVGLEEGLHRLVVLRAEGDVRDVDVAVGHRQHAEVLLRDRLAVRGELGRGADRRRLRRLAARVRVDLGVEDEDVDVLVRGEDVVEAAVADVVGPAVAADDPDALLDEVVGELVEDLRRLGVRPRRAPSASSGAPRRAARCAAMPASFVMSAFRISSTSVSPSGAESCPQKVLRAVRSCVSTARRIPEPELGVVLEERVGPGRAAPVAVRRRTGSSGGCRRRSRSSPWRSR